jgi:hypothetical protein
MCAAGRPVGEELLSEFFDKIYTWVAWRPVDLSDAQLFKSWMDILQKNDCVHLEFDSRTNETVIAGVSEGSNFFNIGSGPFGEDVNAEQMEQVEANWQRVLGRADRERGAPVRVRRVRTPAASKYALNLSVGSGTADGVSGERELYPDELFKAVQLAVVGNDVLNATVSREELRQYISDAQDSALAAEAFATYWKEHRLRELTAGGVKAKHRLAVLRNIGNQSVFELNKQKEIARLENTRRAMDAAVIRLTDGAFPGLAPVDDFSLSEITVVVDGQSLAVPLDQAIQGKDNTSKLFRALFSGSSNTGIEVVLIWNAAEATGMFAINRAGNVYADLGLGQVVVPTFNEVGDVEERRARAARCGEVEQRIIREVIGADTDGDTGDEMEVNEDDASSMEGDTGDESGDAMDTVDALLGACHDWLALRIAERDPGPLRRPLRADGTPVRALPLPELVRY